MHTIREKQRLLTRVRRIKDQVEAIERALENEAGCGPVLPGCSAPGISMTMGTRTVGTTSVARCILLDTNPDRQTAEDVRAAIEAHGDRLTDLHV